MKLTRIWSVVLGLILLSGGLSAAEESQPNLGLWITPFGGYRLNGSVELDDPNYQKLDITDNSVYGLALGLDVYEGGVVEFMWTHHATDVAAIPQAGGPQVERFDLDVDQFHLNGLYFPPGFENARTQPYAMAGLGMTRYSPSVSNTASMNRFSWALGGGMQIAFTPLIGLRLEGKWDPSLVSSSSTVFCNSATGRCYAAASGDLIEQFDFTAGLTIHL